MADIDLDGELSTNRFPLLQKKYTSVFLMHLYGNEFCRSWGRLSAVREIDGLESDSPFLIDCWHKQFANEKAGIIGFERQGRIYCGRDLRPRKYLSCYKGRPGVVRYYFEGEQVTIEDNNGSNVVQLGLAPDIILEPNFFSCLDIYERFANKPLKQGFSVFLPQAKICICVDVVDKEGALETSLNAMIKFGCDGAINTLSGLHEEWIASRVHTPVPRWRFFSRELKRQRPLDKSVKILPPVGVKYRELFLDAAEGTVDATLASPINPGIEAPVGLFIGGSGFYDQHGHIGEFDIGYRRILDKLALMGISTLRFERYPKEVSTSPARLADYGYGDVRLVTKAAMGALIAAPEAQNRPVHLIAHSLGCLLALDLAANNPAIAGLLLLAPPGHSLKDVVLRQAEKLLPALGAGSEQTAQLIEKQRQLYIDLANREEDYLSDPRNELLKLQPGIRMFADLLNVDPLQFAQKLSCPVTLVIGSEDFQVEPDSVIRLGQALYDAGRLNKIIIAQGLGHTFRRVSGSAQLFDFNLQRRKVPQRLIVRLASELMRLQSHNVKTNFDACVVSIKF